MTDTDEKSEEPVCPPKSILKTTTSNTAKQPKFTSAKEVMNELDSKLSENTDNLQEFTNECLLFIREANWRMRDERHQVSVPQLAQFRRKANLLIKKLCQLHEFDYQECQDADINWLATNQFKKNHILISEEKNSAKAYYPNIEAVEAVIGELDDNDCRKLIALNLTKHLHEMRSYGLISTPDIIAVTNSVIVCLELNNNSSSKEISQVCSELTAVAHKFRSRSAKNLRLMGNLLLGLALAATLTVGICAVFATGGASLLGASYVAKCVLAASYAVKANSLAILGCAGISTYSGACLRGLSNVASNAHKKTDDGQLNQKLTKVVNVTQNHFVGKRKLKQS